MILGRPFLATGRAVIDVQKGELVMRVENEEIKFNVFKALKYLIEDSKYVRISTVQEDFQELAVEDCLFMDALKAALTNMIDEREEVSKAVL